MDTLVRTQRVHASCIAMHSCSVEPFSLLSVHSGQFGSDVHTGVL